jgi:hypothetical protein
VAGLLFGCTDLEPQLIGITTGDEFLAQFQEDIEDSPDQAAFNVIGAIYNTVNAFIPQDGIWALGTHSSDEMQGPTRGTDWDDGGIWRVLHTHDWDPFHRMITASWDNMNQGTARAYAAIQLFEDAGAVGIPAVDQAIAETRTLRAFFMWNILDLFGQVPALDDEGNPIVFDRATATEFIIAELEDAVRNLPNKGSYPADQYYRWDKAAAYGLLAKVYMNRNVYLGRGFDNADMQKVVENVDAAAAQGYQIADDYWNIFALDNDSNNAADSELIIQIRNRDNVNQGGPSHSRVFMTLHYNMKMGRPDFEPWNGFTTIADFYNTWDEDGDPSNGVTSNDTRFSDDRYFDETAVNNGFLVGQQFSPEGEPLTTRQGQPLVFTVDIPLNGATEAQGVRAIKYQPDTDTGAADLSDTDFSVLRYSDLHLLKAEAMWRMGNGGQAVDLINELRATRGATPIESISADGQEILDERGYELWWEGYRRQDLIRFGKFLDDWTNKGGRSEEKALLFPIPQTALDVNPNLVQNEGY